MTLHRPKGKVKNIDKDKLAYFSQKNGLHYAGTHLLIDFWQADHLDDVKIVKRALRLAVKACGATLMKLYVHQFSGGGGGIQGAAVLAQSHITIHSWPELGYAAFDTFLCGECDPYAIIPVLQKAFMPGHVQIAEYRRGVLVSSEKQVRPA